MLEIRGVQEIISKLRTLEKRIQNKAVRKSLRIGQKQMADASKAAAPVGKSGLLRKSIIVRSAKRKKNRIGVNTIFRTSNFKDFYPAYVEYRKDQKNYGWQRSVFTSNASRVMSTMQNELLKEVNEAIGERG